MDWIVIAGVGGAIVAVLLLTSWKNRKGMEARPRITRAEVQAVFDQMEAERLPLVRLIPDAEQAPAPLATRIGGPPWSEAGGDWPMDRSGAPYLFLAQINFAEVPPLPGYPEKGLLQVFVEWEGRGLASGDYDEVKTHLLRWFPEPSVGELLPIPAQHLDRKSQPFTSAIARERGLSVRFEADVLPATPYALPVEKIWPNDAKRLPESEEVSEMLGRIELMGDELGGRYGAHRIGGHPTFTQEDFRHDPSLADIDRVLLHLGFDDHVCIGDAGEINLMIRAEDLANRRFDKAYYYWDCT